MLSVFSVVLFLAADTPKTPAYSAVRVVTFDGKVSRWTVTSDGVRTKSVSEDGKSGNYRDESLKTSWQWGVAYGCIHISDDAPLPVKGTNTRKEEVLGTETVDGHPAKKVKVTSTFKDEKGKETTYVDVVWRATDLQDLVIRTETPDGRRKTRLEKLVIGKPDAKLVAFPAPPCDAAEAAAIATARPAASGGSRTIRFDQGACELMVPMAISMSIPSDYTIRAMRPLGCFWGADDDLTRLLKNKSEADFASIRRGVFWIRPSESTEYNPSIRRFVSEAGPHDKWADAYRAMGAQNVIVTPKMIGAYPATTVTLTANGQRSYMLYLAPPNTGTIAMLINYRPAGKGGAADDEVWKTFVNSLSEVKR